MCTGGCFGNGGITETSKESLLKKLEGKTIFTGNGFVDVIGGKVTEVRQSAVKL